MLHDWLHGCKLFAISRRKLSAKKEKEYCWEAVRMSYVLAKMINGQIHFSFVEVQRMKKSMLVKKVKMLRNFCG